MTGLKLCFLTLFVPSLISLRTKLRSASSTAERFRLIGRAVKQYLGAAGFLMLGNAEPFIMFCMLPLNTSWFRKWPIAFKIMCIYITCCVNCLVIESASRMPAYMGFVQSKVISQVWRLLKAEGLVNKKGLPHEKFVTFALLAGLIGFVSVKQAQGKDRVAVEFLLGLLT